MPALAESDECKNRIVAAGVAGPESSRPKDVTQRINCKGSVPKEDRAHSQTPHEPRSSSDDKQGDSHENNGNQRIAI